MTKLPAAVRDRSRTLRRSIACAIALGTGVIVAALAPPVVAGDTEPGRTEVHATWFIDATHLDQSTPDARNHSNGVDMKRFYLDVRHGFDPVWSVRATTDVNWLRDARPTDVWLKYAYLQGAFGKAFHLRVGAAPTPWVGFANHWYGYRFVEKELVMRTGTGISSDWGIHALGRFGAGDRFDYAVSIVTGGSYKRPHTGSSADVEARLAWQPTPHAVFAVGGYAGHLAEDGGIQPALHSARRWNALVAYADSRWRIGAQYFHADNWRRVLAPAADASRGWSAWASVQLTRRLALFARHDASRPSLRLLPARRERFSTAGLAWTLSSRIRVALAWKRERLDSAGATLKSADEVGVWSQVAL